METQRHRKITLQHLLIGGEPKRRLSFSPATLLSGRAVILLKIYTEKCQPKAFLFEGPYGRTYSLFILRQEMHQALQKAGNEVFFSLHSLRNSFETHLKGYGTDLSYFRNPPDHNSSKITETYPIGGPSYVNQAASNNLQCPPDCLDISPPNRMLGTKLR